MKFRRGNRIRLLRNVEEYFPALEREIDAAASEIFLETYIFEPDDTGQRIAAALMRLRAIILERERDTEWARLQRTAA